MIPDPRYTDLPQHFRANVRTIGQAVGYTVGQAVGYTVRGVSRIKIPTIGEIKHAYSTLTLSTEHLFGADDVPTRLGDTLLEYLAHRAEVLNDYVEPRLMEVTRARETFTGLKNKLRPRCLLPMNKQRGKKKGSDYFTVIINMIIEANSGEIRCDYDPRVLTTITRDSVPLRTLARRVDGAFPGPVNPVVVWEIKEYYHTTTFGSRVADGVYKTLLDGMELDELRRAEGRVVSHYLFVDSHYTWWDCDRSYLCRIIDMMHMGFVSEVLFGYEVVERLPRIVKGWRRLVKER